MMGPMSVSSRATRSKVGPLLRPDLRELHRLMVL
jgi:hypothetical protein